MKTNKQMEKGFTLVELSIVLVIIGLIIGGVLVGQDLIIAAQMRGTIQQLEKYNSAMNAFRGKYSKLPGDVDNATSFGFTGNGDGDGQLEDGMQGITLATGEITYIWDHLESAGMADGTYDGVQTGGTVGGTFPRTKFGRGGITVYHVNGVNYYQIGAANASMTTMLTADVLSTVDAWNLDKKIDDGIPDSGNVWARSGTAPNTAVTNGASACMAAGGAYNLSYTTTNPCQLRVKMNY